MNIIGPLAPAVPLIEKKITQRSHRGDFADRLNSRITVVILAVSCALLGTGHIWGKPINCWTPAQFTSRWNDFIDQCVPSSHPPLSPLLSPLRYCYVHGTYYAPLDEDLTHDTEERRKNEINYYQWIPYILALQAFLFFIPRFLRGSITSRFGYDISGAIGYVEEFWSNVKSKPELFKNRLSSFETGPAVYIWEGLRLARRKSSRNLSTYYAVATVVQMLNAWVQWYWLNSLLRPRDSPFWGPRVFFDLITGRDWQVTGHFPRIVHCDFQRRGLASVQVSSSSPLPSLPPHSPLQLETVLCVLHLNIYYEKICLFLWFWMLFVAIVSTWSAFFWIYSIFRSTANRKVIDLLSVTPEVDSTPTRDRFFSILGSDGLFVLQHVALNLGDLPASYLAAAMRNCCEKYEEEEKRERFYSFESPINSKS
ncbi:hypothetical protein PMAYCL1PPCAC_17975 [Pristionchus mayeri]|uniref:Innexin n=1 Tax=Pristionchus mayeri TaxID=1317129 RepID=A0AAN5CNN9_9BILA|nr:hypothetical protein PMAYCL1PPCAC_17975 [Pristionchus mayeri]